MAEPLAARFRRLEPLLDRALALEGAERERFVQMCAEIHPDLIGPLREALAAGEDTLPMLGELAAAAVRASTTGRRNLRAGSWRLLERIGRGGMGTVYLAERAEDPAAPRVAIKLLRGQDRMRFRDQLERERSVLARLSHPGIARLIDGGVLDDDQPYLVMELAPGEELHGWLRTQVPSLERRLRVFLAICAAVAHAHDARIVHRDLKPTNIRVDAQDRVKLLDFGIAKLLDAAAAQDTRQLALTPEYAAPEQLAGGRVDARADVYALGALLHLLLTGRSPHPRFDGNWAGYADLLRSMPRPLPSAAVAEAAAPALPPEQLRGNLDAIVQHALALDPEARYPSAEALADDVARHLDGRRASVRAGWWQLGAGRRTPRGR